MAFLVSLLGKMLLKLRGGPAHSMQLWCHIALRSMGHHFTPLEAHEAMVADVVDVIYVNHCYDALRFPVAPCSFFCLAADIVHSSSLTFFSLASGFPIYWVVVVIAVGISPVKLLLPLPIIILILMLLFFCVWVGSCMSRPPPSLFSWTEALI